MHLQRIWTLGSCRVAVKRDVSQSSRSLRNEKGCADLTSPSHQMSEWVSGWSTQKGSSWDAEMEPYRAYHVPHWEARERSRPPRQLLLPIVLYQSRSRRLKSCCQGHGPYFSFCGFSITLRSFSIHYLCAKLVGSEAGTRWDSITLLTGTGFSSSKMEFSATSINNHKWVVSSSLFGELMCDNRLIRPSICGTGGMYKVATYSFRTPRGNNNTRHQLATSRLLRIWVWVDSICCVPCDLIH